MDAAIRTEGLTKVFGETRALNSLSLEVAAGEVFGYLGPNGADLLVLDEPTSGLDPLMEQAFRHSVTEARERGQAVFLSSHILSEVEALCDRVAILRAGDLIEVGTLAQMRHLSAVLVEAEFDSAPPDLSQLPGARDIHVQGNRVQCQVTGPVRPLLEVLAASPVRHLLMREPSLEELFLAIYGSAGAPGEVSRAA